MSRNGKRETNLQTYGAFDLDALDALEAKYESGGGAGGADFLKTQPGKNPMRFLPPPRGQKSPFVAVQEHYIDTPNGRARFACPRRMEKLACPACEQADSLRRTGNTLDREEAYKLYPKLRVYANVVDRTAGEGAPPKIYAFPKTVWEGLKRIRRDIDEGGDFTNPGEDGFDIVIFREGTGKMDTKYDVRPARNDSALGDMSVIEKQYDLEKYSAIPSLEEAIAIMKGDEVSKEPAQERLELSSGDVIDAEYSERAPEKRSKKKRKSKTKTRSKKANEAIYDVEDDDDIIH